MVGAASKKIRQNRRLLDDIINNLSFVDVELDSFEEDEENKVNKKRKSKEVVIRRRKNASAQSNFTGRSN